MATKLYFHDAVNALAGTFPAGEQSSLALGNSSTKVGSLRTFNTTIGVAQTSASFSSTATTAAQNAFLFWGTTPPLDVNQTVGTTTDAIELSVANQESSTNMNFGAPSTYKLSLYVWRPSTGAIVGTVCDALAFTGTVEPSASTVERSNNGSITGTVSAVAALAGDVVIAELWTTITQATAANQTGILYYDGTTETLTDNTTVSNHASFLTLKTTTLTFTVATTGTRSATLGATTVAATGGVAISGSATLTLASATVTAAGDLGITGEAPRIMGDADVRAFGTVTDPAPRGREAQDPGAGHNARKKFVIPDPDMLPGKGLEEVFGRAPAPAVQSQAQPEIVDASPLANAVLIYSPVVKPAPLPMQRPAVVEDDEGEDYMVQLLILSSLV